MRAARPVVQRPAAGGDQPGRADSKAPNSNTHCTPGADGKCHLRPATPNLGNVFTVLNHLFNQLGYNTEPSGQHNYLWWLAWLDHNARTLFSIQDANGDFRPLFLQANCNTYGQMLTCTAHNAWQSSVPS